MILINKKTGKEYKFYSWSKDEKYYYEVDFLIARGTKICPIEVKSSGYKTHLSLDAFAEKYSSRIGDRYLAHIKALRRANPTILLPIYMLGLI